MRTRPKILIGMAAGLVWAVAVLWIGRQIPVPMAMMQPTLMGAAFGPGVVLALMIGRLAQRRFFDDSEIDCQPLTGGAAVDAKVLQNTVEQVVLALCIWPLVGFFLGAGTVLALGIGFAVARVAFWVGYHMAPPLRAFGFAATFYPTVLAALWVLWRLTLG
ncbi:MAPEG family protein [Roseovarius sp. THAF9]|uniref:MAPEG family protein n=1 Tax=Roseovarius sp. THAF9 TaxID=2587847 RepID=UPI0012A9A5E2|nr:MAPEG family protein [Roseovarius sp. THAF9]QFT93443.1 MAPEG family protein [Roseovarius sp. THAF9]